ncbi:ArdC-like ssDNA-binding domain-containing protein [Enterococcus faecium]|uniref:Uncharacterized protein n=1 Tax=Enterococcus faecium TaxID=1352 RepID=A0A242BDQ3_ENTFC|nr:ArdC-like ssDNA-binding domain-containing protein [Enterococcus faecium]OTN93635.1 hypothetical protein A5810_001511 [Enterococcus faecium]
MSKQAPMKSNRLQTLLAEKDTKKLAQFLKEQVDEYKNSEMFKNYLDFIAKCPKYSSHNIQFLLKQKPTIGLVGTFTQWKKQGYHIKKGSKGFKIFMPIIGAKCENGKPILDENNEKVLEVKGFKLGTVFEDKQLVEYEELPKPVSYLNQDPSFARELFIALAEISEVKVELKPLEVDGYYSSTEKKIFINSKLHGADLLHTFIHEITHAKLHSNTVAQYGEKQYSIQELEAESTAYIVANNYGIDTSTYTMGYLNSWGLQMISSEALMEVMENVQQAARELIEKIDSELNKQKETQLKKTALQTEIEMAKEKQSDLQKELREKIEQQKNKEQSQDKTKTKEGVSL